MLPSAVVVVINVIVMILIPIAVGVTLVFLICYYCIFAKMKSEFHKLLEERSKLQLRVDEANRDLQIVGLNVELWIKKAHANEARQKGCIATMLPSAVVVVISVIVMILLIPIAVGVTLVFLICYYCIFAKMKSEFHKLLEERYKSQLRVDEANRDLQIVGLDVELWIKKAHANEA
ncbi:hypothetical protein LguiA_029340 [Lonicera macranthoides]